VRSPGISALPGFAWPGRTALCALIVALTAGACATTHHYDYSTEPDPRRQEFVLGPSDVLKVVVWRNNDLSGEATVRPDGTISLPLVGDLRAAGRTPGQVRAEITQRLATFIKDESSVVTVVVADVKSYRFIVSGNVERSGEYTATRYVTVSEAIGLAGGPNKFADAAETVIMRTDPKGVRRIPVDYPGIMNGAHPEQDLPLLAGDRIFVP
jgi:polysaccharide export outer membrane protein